MDGDEDARRRARAGGTLASAVELRTDGTARGARDRCVFACSLRFRVDGSCG